MTTSIAEVPTTTLRALLDALERSILRTPVQREALLAYAAPTHIPFLQNVLGGHSRPACTAILRNVLEERSHHVRPTPELVWTGPESSKAQARDTSIVLRELFESARTRVILAGYSFRDAESVLAPLARAIEEHGVEAYFFVDVPQPERAEPDEEAYGRAQLTAFLEANWPFSSRPPRLYCDRRALKPGSAAGYSSLHAKCVSVDARWAFVSSANFTRRGQDRNIETGVLLDDPRFAQQLDRQWLTLIQSGFVLTRDPA